jgi:hypothetical protein
MLCKKSLNLGLGLEYVFFAIRKKLLYSFFAKLWECALPDVSEVEWASPRRFFCAQR